MRAITSGVFWSLLLLILTSSSSSPSSSLHQQLRLSTAAAAEDDMVPLVEPGKMEMMVMVNESRRKLGSFQICSLCTCCGGASRSYCLPSPCCYAINCNIPNRPFGFCSFTPKTCNCLACHL
ncbi:ubiquitin carboxyl-terminal hydrolase [Perilla frutescens var. frutescens]|nr:ubiquitin carboxyl-terminal hydrolase [Perilla frutescens var. frutescens]